MEKLATSEINKIIAIRKQLGLSQAAFAERLGISFRTLQEWEQGRHQPSGPALALLRIADQEPEVFLRVR
jgi:putative transcriptional regulator